jgi:hypothetical protein
MAADGLMRVIVDAGHRGHAAVTVAPAPERPVAALLMVRRAAARRVLVRRVAQLRTAALLTAVDRMAAVSTTNPQHLAIQESQAAKPNSFAAFACCFPVTAAVLDA